MSLFQLRQSLLLLLTAFIWGCTFVAQSTGMDHVSPFTFTASRTLLGCLVLLPVVAFMRAKLRREKPQEWAKRQTPEYKRTLLLGGLLCGLCLFGGESLQQFGLFHDTEAGKAGFITSLYIVLVPVIGLLLGSRSRLMIWASVAVACVGLWFLCIPPEGISIRLGDLYVLLCALVFSLHILVIGRFVTKVNGIELSVAQFAVGGILGLIAMPFQALPTWEGWLGALPAILWAGIMSNGIAYTLQIVGQRGMNDTAASLIMSLESVFSVLAGWVVLGEVLSGRELAGCIIMAAAVVMAQLPERKTREPAALRAGSDADGSSSR